MASSLVSPFRKTADCPASQLLLACRRSLLTTTDKECIESHLATCDFCSAELQLLTRYRNEAEEYSFAEMPGHLRRLAEVLLKKETTPFRGFAEPPASRQASH